nr:rhomboid-like protein [Gordonia humi]
MAILLVTTIVQHTASDERVETILGRRSTNIGNLRHDPIRSMITSMFWLDGAYWLPYLIGFTVFVAVAERWLGRWRLVAVGFGGHVVATLVSQFVLYEAIAARQADPALRSAVDVGVSYVMAALIGVLAYRTAGRWRVAYIAVCLVAFGTPLVVDGTFTDVGHATALLFGFAMYPLTRTLPRVRRARDWFARAASHPPIVRHRNS